MKITRIDQQTVNCIITEEDLDEQGVRFEDIIQKKENAVAFLKEILERAGEEVGYEPKGNVTSMQAIVLTDGSISLTLSENPLANLRDTLEQITSRLGIRIPERILKEIGDAPEEERLERLKEFVLNFKDFSEIFRQMVENHVGAQAQLTPAIGTGVRRPKNGKGHQKRLLFHEYVFSFDSMQHLIRYAQKIPESVRAKSAVYRDTDGSYLLFLSIGAEQEMVFASMFTIGYEYGRYVTTNRKQILYMKEHSDVVIAEDALQKLRLVEV